MIVPALVNAAVAAVLTFVAAIAVGAGVIGMTVAAGAEQEEQF